VEKAPLAEKTPEIPAKKPKRWWMAGVAMAAAAVALSLAIPNLHRVWAQYTVIETMPVVRPKTPPVPALPVVKVEDVEREDMRAEEPRSAKPKPVEAKPVKSMQRFEGPQIALDVPAEVRRKVAADARVEVVVAIDEQGNVIKAEVASTKGKGARLLTKGALAAARSSRFRPAREGERPVESQMVLTYLFKPESAEF
jgi:TonB family protein